MNLIAEKKKVFHDLKILWNEEIEREYARQIFAYPKANPEVILDNICRTHLEYAFEHETETYYSWLKAKYPNGNAISQKSIQTEVGEDGFSLLISAGLIKQIPDKKRYILAY